MGWLFMFVAGTLIYLGYVNHWALSAFIGAFLLAATAYNMGCEAGRHEPRAETRRNGSATGTSGPGERAQ